jgi:hypothetical protein
MAGSPQSSSRPTSRAGGACLSELSQIDGSEHAWFEDRGPPCTMLSFVDDATSRLMRLQFVASESAFDYFRTTRAYLEKHGKPVAFYGDGYGIFRANSKDGVPWLPRAPMLRVPIAARRRAAIVALFR